MSIPTVEIESLHTPKVTVRHIGFCGSMGVFVDDFMYVEVNYDYRYTCNSARAELAEKIAEYVRGNQRVFMATVKDSK
jgi:endo-alpha-1,4-polygalactosaminidase (GH114 family)